MKRFIIKNYLSLLFFIAAAGVAFLIASSYLKPKSPAADVAEANNPAEVKSAFAIKQEIDKLAKIPKNLMPEPRQVSGSLFYTDYHQMFDDLGIEYDSNAIVIEKGIPAKYGIGFNEYLIYDPLSVYIDYGGEDQAVVTTWAKNVHDLVEQIKSETKINYSLLVV